MRSNPVNPADCVSLRDVLAEKQLSDVEEEQETAKIEEEETKRVCVLRDLCGFHAILDVTRCCYIS